MKRAPGIPPVEQLACDLRSLASSQYSHSLPENLQSKFTQPMPALALALIDLASRLKAQQTRLPCGVTPDTGDGKWWRQWDV